MPRILICSIFALAALLGPAAGHGFAHGVMTIPASRAIGSENEDYQYCFGAPECQCGEFPEAGPIAATYEAGQSIQVTIEVTVTHDYLPFFRFQLCPADDQSPDCFAEGEFATADFDLALGLHTYEIQLPEDLVCDPCVLRWKWDYGFLSCADVRIVAVGTPVTEPSWSTLKSMYRGEPAADQPRRNR